MDNAKGLVDNVIFENKSSIPDPKINRESILKVICDNATRLCLDTSLLKKIYVVDNGELGYGGYAYVDHKKEKGSPYIFMKLSALLIEDFNNGLPRSTKTIVHELGHVHLRCVMINNGHFSRLKMQRLTRGQLTNATSDQLFASALHFWDEYQAERRAAIDDEYDNDHERAFSNYFDYFEVICGNQKWNADVVNFPTDTNKEGSWKKHFLDLMDKYCTEMGLYRGVGREQSLHDVFIKPREKCKNILYQPLQDIEKEFDTLYNNPQGILLQNPLDRSISALQRIISGLDAEISKYEMKRGGRCVSSLS